MRKIEQDIIKRIGKYPRYNDEQCRGCIYFNYSVGCCCYWEMKKVLRTSIVPPGSEVCTVRKEGRRRRRGALGQESNSIDERQRYGRRISDNDKQI